RGICGGDRTRRHDPAGTDGRDLPVAVHAARPQRRLGLCARHPRHLHPLDAVLPARAAGTEGGNAMTDAAADSPRVVADARSAGRFVFVTGTVLLVVWVLVPLYLLAVNTLSSPQEVSGFPKSGMP